VKLAYILKHADVVSGDKGYNFFNKVKVFIDMYGDVDKYWNSLIFIISKCNEHYSLAAAKSYFEGISELQLIKNHPNVLKLVKRLAEGKIPILIMHLPKFINTASLVSIENA
jgi:hypothetical protein